MITFRLKEILQSKGMTITELHERTGLSKNTLSLMVNGKSKGIQYDTLGKIIEATRASVADLIEVTDNLYCLFVKGINNDYTALRDSERRTFRYQVWNDMQAAGEQLIYDIEFSAILFKGSGRKSRTFLHIEFLEETGLEDRDYDLATKLNTNLNKAPINAIAFLIVTDILWNMEIPDLSTFSLAYFNWLGFERDNSFGLSINIPIAQASKSIELSRKKGSYGKGIANFGYLKASFPDVEDYLFDEETGEAAVFIHSV